jgi:hypothetical protein
MDLASSYLAALGAAELVRVSASIPRAAPRTFALLTACLVFPLSFAPLHRPAGALLLYRPADR